MDEDKKIVHAESTAKRLSNPDHHFKPEEEHIIHVLLRIKERFGLDLTITEYYIMLDLANKADVLYPLNGSNSVRQITYKSISIWVILGQAGKKGTKWAAMPRRLKTVLIPHKAFALPDVVAKHMNKNDFTSLVHSIIEKLKELSLVIDMDNKRDFFVNNPSSLPMKKGAFHYKKNEMHKVYRIVINHIIRDILNEVDESGAREEILT